MGNEYEHFETTMKAYRKEVGTQACSELYLIYAEVTNWLIVEGWGKATLSAINHRFSNKIRVDAVKEVKLTRSYN